MKELTRILVPVDGSGSSDRAVEMAGTLAMATGATLDILHVSYFDSQTDDERVSWLPDVVAAPVGEKIAAILDRAKAHVPDGVKAEYHQRQGVPVDEIVAFAKEGSHHLIVIGAHGFNLVEGFLKGSVSQQVLEQVSCSVLIVK